eukprot:3934243-Prymnesium_polylepis.2
MSRRFCFHSDTFREPGAAKSGVFSALTLRPSAACGLAGAPARGTCGASGKRAWLRQPCEARLTRGRDRTAATRR